MFQFRKNHTAPDHIIYSLKNSDAEPLLQWIEENEQMLSRIASAYIDTESKFVPLLSETVISAHENVTSVKHSDQFEPWFLKIFLQLLESGLDNKSGTAAQLDVLDPHTRQIIVLSVYGNISAEVIAVILNMSEEKIQLKMHRGLKYIQACF